MLRGGSHTHIYRRPRRCGAGGWRLLVSTAILFALSIGITEKAAAQAADPATCNLTQSGNSPLGGAFNQGTTFSNVDALACGQNTQAENARATAVGSNALATSTDSSAFGAYSDASGTGFDTALGVNTKAKNEFATAVGYGAQVFSGDHSTAMGAQSLANGANDTALGANATVDGFNNSTAVGAGAVATNNNQLMMATKNETITAPGITSNLSRSRQSGPLEMVTSDANGNIATDNGQIFNSIDRLNQRSDDAFEGVALALAATGPDLTGNERFGVSANWGNFEGANAFGMGLEGVLAKDVLTMGDRLAITAGWGVGFSQNNGNDVFGGRVGGQWTWGHSPVAYSVAPSLK